MNRITIIACTASNDSILSASIKICKLISTEYPLVIAETHSLVGTSYASNNSIASAHQRMRCLFDESDRQAYLVT
jgi:hypothetical protein